MDKLPTRVFEIGEGRVEIFPGNYEDYLWRKEGKGSAAPDLSLSSNGDRATGPSSAQDNEPDEAAPAAEMKAKRIDPIKLKHMKDRCRAMVKEAVRLEDTVIQAEGALQHFASA